VLSRVEGRGRKGGGGEVSGKIRVKGKMWLVVRVIVGIYQTDPYSSLLCAGQDHLYLSSSPFLPFEEIETHKNLKKVKSN